MEKELSCIVTIRNREARRFEMLVRSMRQNGGNPHVLLIDYGSEGHFSDSYLDAVHALGGPIEYVKMWTEGWPWNKCRAINHGVRLARTEYVCTSDVDMLYSSNPFGYCLDKRSPRSMFHIDTYWLSRDGRLDKARPAGRGNPGGFQFLPKSAFSESGGYDERMVYWGLEDLDWPERLKALGYAQEWLPEPHKIYHQWHPRSENGHKRPETASFNTMACCIQNRLRPVLDQDWGRGVARTERPILDAIASGKVPVAVDLRPNALMHYGNIDRLLEAKKTGAFVKVGLGQRTIQRPLSAFAAFTTKLLRPLTALTGLNCQVKMNCNFDYLYSMIPALCVEGLVDYYFASDLSTAFLFWG